MQSFIILTKNIFYVKLFINKGYEMEIYQNKDKSLSAWLFESDLNRTNLYITNLNKELIQKESSLFRLTEDDEYAHLVPLTSPLSKDIKGILIENCFSNEIIPYDIIKKYLNIEHLVSEKDYYAYLVSNSFSNLV
jgi:hypothetical protein